MTIYKKVNIIFAILGLYLLTLDTSHSMIVEEQEALTEHKMLHGLNKETLEEFVCQKKKSEETLEKEHKEERERREYQELMYQELSAFDNFLSQHLHSRAVITLFDTKEP